MKLAFIYSGQGAQTQYMGRDFYENFSTVRDFYDGLDSRIRDLSFRASLEDLTQTQNTQPVMVAFQIALTDLLEEHGIKPQATAGLSIGEYSALYASGVLTKKAAVDIASYRGQRMAHYSQELETAMLAVLGLEEKDLKKMLIEENLEDRVFISNINTRGQIVLTTKKEEISKLESLLKKRKLRAIPLRVSGPFHTPYMAPVAKELEEYFRKVDFRSPKIKLAMNLTGNFEEENLREIMSRQVMETVRFKDNLEILMDEVDAFIEIGHGRVLAGFIKRLDPKKPVYEIKDMESFSKALEEIHEKSSSNNRSL